MVVRDAVVIGTVVVIRDVDCWVIVTVRVENEMVDVRVEDCADVNESDVVSNVVVAVDVVVVEDESVEIDVLVDAVVEFVRTQPTSPKQSKKHQTIEYRIRRFIVDLHPSMTILYHKNEQ